MCLGTRQQAQEILFSYYSRLKTIFSIMDNALLRQTYPNLYEYTNCIYF